ncbi:MAG: NAD(P)-dependent oxidoreductase [Planctomycetota bacterium]
MTETSGRLVIQSEELDAEAAGWLAARTNLQRVLFDSDEFGRLLPQADGLVVRTYTRVDRRLLDAAPTLAVIGRAGVGLDNIDLEACAERGIAVVHTPGANSRAVVEYVLALTFDALRPRLFLQESMDLVAWKKLRGELIAPRQLSDLTVGVLGFGRIGSQVARAMTALDADVLYHDVREVEEGDRFGAKPVTLHELAERSDVLTVHVDGRPGNRHLVNADVFGRLKSDVVFINTSRGMVVEPRACAAFMGAHSGATAMLDVHDPEPIEDDSPLWQLPNVHLAPHIAGATATAKRAMSWVVKDVWRVLAGEKPCYAAVDPSSGKG